MNRIYNLVWNHKRGIVQVASELARSSGKQAGSRAARRQSRRGLALAGAALWVLGGGLLLSDAAAADTFTVTQTVDDGSAGTLSWAIEQANADAGSTIEFDLVDGATIEAGSGRPAIHEIVLFDNAHDLTIAGDLSSSGQVIGKQGDGALKLEDADLPGPLLMTAGDLTLGNGSNQVKAGTVTLQSGTRLTNAVASEITGGEGKYGVNSSGPKIVNNGAIFGGAGADGMSNGDAGGAGVQSDTDGDSALSNSGTLVGGAGGDGVSGVGGYGGHGVYADNDGDFTLSNADTIRGGAGGDSDAGDGGAGGHGVYGSNDGDFTLSNAGTIRGGAGGDSDTGDGGAGGHGVYADNDGNFTLSNAGTIRGGAGGASGGYPGDGGAGVYAANSGLFELTNDGLIVGGASDASGGKYSTNAGIERSNGSLTVHNTGTIRGGAGNNDGCYGGAGVKMDAGQLTLDNEGTIEGIDGGAGIDSDNSDFELTNTGTIQGSDGIASQNFNNAVDFNLMNKGTIRSNADGNGVSIVTLFDGSHFVLDNSGQIRGGAGDQGDDGGDGIYLLGGGESDFALTNAGTIQGGVGGRASGGADGGSGGDALSGGFGLLIGGRAEFSFSNQGQILGGTGGAGGDGYYDDYGAHGNAGGAGLELTVFGARLTNAGLIAGGRADAGAGKRAPAILLQGEDNTLTLAHGYAFKGNVISGFPESGTGAATIPLTGDNTLVLGGDANAVFNLSQIASADEIAADRIEVAGDATHYYGFTEYKKTGTSSWALTGATTDDSPWTVAQGRLIGGAGAGGQAELGGDVEVKAGAVLGGNLIVHGALSGQGTLSPGHSVGTMRFGKDDDFAGDYQAEVNAAGASDLVTIETGDFDLSDVDLYVSGENDNGGAKIGHSYTIVQAPGGISGEFENGGELKGSIAHSLLQLDPLIYGDDQVQVRLSINASKAGDLTDNQGAVLKHIGDNPAALAAVASPAYQDALDSLSGELHASTQTALLDAGDMLVRTLSNRMRGSAGVDRQPNTAPTQSADVDGSHTMDATAGGPWGQVVGSWQRHAGDRNTARSKYAMGGLYLGGDAVVGRGWRIGGALGHTDGTVKIGAHDSKADIKNYTVAIYGGNDWALGSGRVNVLAGAGYTYHRIDTQRHVSVGGQQNLDARYHGNTIQLFTQLSYTLPVTEHSAVEPYAGLAWSDLHTQGFAESGGPAALRGESDHNATTTTDVGVRGHYEFDLDGRSGRLMAGLGWRHAFGDRAASRTLALRQGNGGAFQVAGAPIARNTAVVDLGAQAQMTDNAAIGVSYSGEFGSGNRANSGSLYVRVNF